MSEILSGLQYVEEELHSLIGLTEEYYQLVYDNLPAIEKNIEFTEEETLLLINYFIETKKEGRKEGEEYLISLALQQIKANFIRIRKFLLSKQEIDEILEHFLGDKSRESSFDTFLEKVKEIEGTLQDVTDISFNAIIFSSHLGDQGQGFRVISDHINETSDYLEQRFLTIDTLLQGLIDWHQQLQENIEGIATGQEKAVEEYIGSADSLFQSLTTTFQEVSHLLRNMISNAKGALSPFQELMALIQRQDILRQKMENTIKCIRIIKERYQYYLTLGDGDAAREEILNHIVFLNRALEMIERLLQLMTDSLQQSLTDISDTLGHLLEALKEIQDDAENLSLYLIEEKLLEYQDKKLSMVDYSFQELFSFMENFITILNQISTLVLNITSNTDEFSQHINKMEKELGDVQKRVERLNKIKLLARIELARMDQKGSNFGAEIEDIVKDINRTVGDNRRAYAILKKDLENDLDNFDRIIVENQRHIDAAVKEVDSSIEQLTTANTIINQAVSALNKEVHDLYQNMKGVHEQLIETTGIQEKNQELLSCIQELRGQVAREQKRMLRKFQVQKWQEKDEELHDLFQIFTSYLERFSAKEYLQDTALDEGDEEGELTIF